MQQLKNYKIGFNGWGLTIFLILMVPNFVWMAIPAPNDILRAETLTPVLDLVSDVIQALLVGSTCLVINRDGQSAVDQNLVLTVAFCTFFYLLGWMIYYMEFTGVVVILALCLFPCATFFFFNLAERNGVGMVFSVLFTIVHILRSVLNYLL